MYSVWVSWHDMFCIFLDPEIPCHVIFFSEALYRWYGIYAFFCFFPLCRWHGSLRFLGISDNSHVIYRYYIYKTFLIYRICLHRAPARPVPACFLRKGCPVPYVTFAAPFRTSHFSLRSSHSTLHTLHTSHYALRTPHFTLHTTHFTLHTSAFTLHSSHSTLPNTTLYYKACTKHAPALLCTTKLAQSTAWVLYKNSLNLRGSIPRRATYFQLYQTHSTLRI